MPNREWSSYIIEGIPGNIMVGLVMIVLYRITFYTNFVPFGNRQWVFLVIFFVSTVFLGIRYSFIQFNEDRFRKKQHELEITRREYIQHKQEFRLRMNFVSALAIFVSTILLSLLFALIIHIIKKIPFQEMRESGLSSLILEYCYLFVFIFHRKTIPK